MTETVFPAPEWPLLEIAGEAARFPVRRVFCVGRNYAAHAAEMGNEVDREAPFYFTKSALSVIPSGTALPYPPGTENFHHEMELVVAIGAPAFRTPQDRALEVVFGYAAGLDMTRRDLQDKAKAGRRPWDLGKDLEGGAVIGPIARRTEPDRYGTPGADTAISLKLSAETRQNASLADMVWTVPELIADLSKYYHLAPGDLIMTGTPAGVGAVHPGDDLDGEIAGLPPVRLKIAAPE
ncbi:MAG: fumarylacetoacetate hydrolase family protein [Paracoccus sp. (in: a-proteobacteria)]|nr:fumarylacetoacetate hydrolase family protein [Paracoccus sp. (in: a-proteobacteria)]